MPLNRRQFTAAALAAAAAGATLSGSTPAEASPNRRRPSWDGDLDGLSILQIQSLASARRLSSEELTQAYRDRILRFDDKGINAVLALNPNALADARASDRHRRAYGPRSLLEGVPILLKDNIGTAAQGATAGSRALLGSRPRDAFIVRRLRAAGAVILGKANLSEWANFRSENSTSGWSAVGGLTANPYDTSRTASGSSSGSAAGVAAAFAQVAVGTETNGSIVSPASTNGVVGIKPSLGLVSRSGIVPISSEQDTAGPLGRSVLDVAITLAVMAGSDPSDAVTRRVADQRHGRLRSLANALDSRASARALRGVRLGVWRHRDTGSPGAEAVTDAAIARLRAAGATTIDIALDTSGFGNQAYEALKAEFKRDVNAYLAATPGSHPRDLAGLIAFNQADPIELQYFDQNIFEMSQAAPDADGAYIRSVRAGARNAARGVIEAAIADNRLDAIMAPTTSPAYPITLGQGDAYIFGSSGPAAVAGYPNISVPAGYSDGLPVGVSFFGRRFTDAKLLLLALAFEQAGTPIRHAPALR